MKQIIIYILLILIIPTILILSFKKELNKNKLTKITNEKVRVNRVSKNKIEEIELEDYVMGVVAAEMPLSFEEEALKAQAVCARSYVLRKMIQNKDKEYDVVDTIQNQVYQDDLELRNKWKDKYDDYLKKLKKVVKETTGEYLTYKGEIIETIFFSTSNGKTENSEEVFTKKLPYLRSVDSSWDEETSPVFHTTKQMSLNDFYTKLNLPYNKNEDGNELPQGYVIARALDEITSMKILSRIEGDDTKVKESLLDNLMNAIKLELSKIAGEENPVESVSIAKLKEMKDRLNSGYTSFWS